MIAAGAAPACKMRSRDVPAKSESAASSPGAASAELGRLAEIYWEERLRADPFEATLTGDRRYDDRVPDLSPAARAADLRRLRELRARIAGEAGAVATPEDQVTHAALLAEIDADVARLECGLDEWTVDARSGPQVSLPDLARLQTVSTAAAAEAMAARWRRLGEYLDQQTANLRGALEQGRVAPRVGVTRVLRQLDALLASPVERSPLVPPAATPSASLPAATADRVRGDLVASVRETIVPAFARYRALLHGEILPRARDDDHAGLVHVPAGRACYDRLIQVHTSLRLGAEAVHATGLEEIARLRGEIAALGEKVFGVGDPAKLRARLGNDRKLHFATRDEVERAAAAALARANAAMPRWFGRLPKAACVVKRVEPYEERDTTIAYYRQPAIDGSRPGTYYVNTFEPATRPRFEAEALAFHEAVPGHHTQIAIAQELADLPTFRKHLGPNAFVEGWALYAERLADEMGLYSDDLDRLGRLSFEAWRAARLVVDTGLHALGWSRARAIGYLRDNTLLAENNVENEIDRYIAWPAQALAYKIGELEIRRLRGEAEATLGARFDIRAFHDAVLGSGAVALPALRGIVERWTASVASKH